MGAFHGSPGAFGSFGSQLHLQGSPVSGAGLDQVENPDRPAPLHDRNADERDDLQLQAQLPERVVHQIGAVNVMHDQGTPGLDHRTEEGETAQRVRPGNRRQIPTRRVPANNRRISDDFAVIAAVCSEHRHDFPRHGVLNVHRVGQRTQGVAESQQECLPRLRVLAPGDVACRTEPFDDLSLPVQHWNRFRERPAERAVLSQDAVLQLEHRFAADCLVNRCLHERFLAGWDAFLQPRRARTAGVGEKPLADP